MLFQNCRYCLFICLIRVPEVMLISSVVYVNLWQLFDLVAKGKVVLHRVHIEWPWLLLVCTFTTIEMA